MKLSKLERTVITTYAVKAMVDSRVYAVKSSVANLINKVGSTVVSVGKSIRVKA